MRCFETVAYMQHLCSWGLERTPQHSWHRAYLREVCGFSLVCACTLTFRFVHCPDHCSAQIVRYFGFPLDRYFYDSVFSEFCTEAEGLQPQRPKPGTVQHCSS